MLQGVFDSAVCKCRCQNEELNAAGYCRDPTTLSCTVRLRVACWLAGRGGLLLECSAMQAEMLPLYFFSS